MKKRADPKLIALYEGAIDQSIGDESSKIYLQFQKRLRTLDRFPLEEWVGARKSLFDYCTHHLRRSTNIVPLLKYILAKWAIEYYRDEYEEWMEWE